VDTSSPMCPSWGEGEAEGDEKSLATVDALDERLSAK
jgi:hypothetical protein